MNIKFVFGRQNDHICNKIGKRNGKYVTEVSFLSPINEFYPIEKRACHYSNISMFSCWVKLYGHRTQNDTSVTNQGISILKFQACFNLRPMQPMISRVIAKSGWRGQMGDCTNQMHISPVWTCMKTSEVFPLPNYLMGPLNDPICNKIRQRNGRNVTEVSFFSPVN